MNSNVPITKRRVGRPRNPLNEHDPWSSLGIRRSTHKAFKLKLNQMRSAGLAKTADDALRIMLCLDKHSIQGERNET